MVQEEDSIPSLGSIWFYVFRAKYSNSPEKCGEPAESERAEDRGAALRPKAPGRGGDDPEGGGGSHGNLAVLYFAAREEDHDEVKEGNREI